MIAQLQAARYELSLVATCEIGAYLSFKLQDRKIPKLQNRNIAKLQVAR